MKQFAVSIPDSNVPINIFGTNLEDAVKHALDTLIENFFYWQNSKTAKTCDDIIIKSLKLAYMPELDLFYASFEKEEDEKGAVVLLLDYELTNGNKNKNSLTKVRSMSFIIKASIEDCPTEYIFDLND